MNDTSASHRGRLATGPRQFDRAGWRDILLRVKQELSEDNIGLIAAGVAFYFLLAIFPMVAAFLSIYGLVFDPAEAQQQISSLAGILPGDARELLTQQTRQLTSGSNSALGFSAALSLLIALWSARQGTSAMTVALNIVYEEEDQRSFVRQAAFTFLLTLVLIVFFIFSLALIAAVPVVLSFLGLGRVAEIALNFLRWPLLGVVAVLALSMLYRYCPDRTPAKWRWLAPGATLAVVLWLISSGLFSWYVTSFGNYNEMYGSVGAVIILLFWFYLTAYIFLLGAELNAEMEHQTREDSTTGFDLPMGERGAYVADNLGEKP
ncbi:MAG: hypothetical protein CL583_15400 [Alteromonadaceae bacterium]|nr:hypothetical protein [Alteromonadaceae bacterium]